MSPRNTKRKYELRKRAETVAATRRRITEAAVALHGTVGPARTTMTAVAERAGVQRHTLYRHFPTEEVLLAACSSHWVAANPRPDPAAFKSIAVPRERLGAALNDLYRYYEQTEQMLANVFRDAQLVEPLQQRVAAYDAYFEAMTRVLTSGWPARGARRRLVAVAIRHAIDFTTWRTLVRNAGSTRAQAVELMCALVESSCSIPTRSG